MSTSRTLWARLLGLSLASVLSWCIPGQTFAADLALKRVMLSAGGVGYFEYEAQVVGDAVLELSVRLDQVDDVLKSVVVYDDKGRAGGIRLPGREPLRSVFRDLPFGPQALTSPVALLQALPGSNVRVSGQRTLEGRLVAVVAEQTRSGSNGDTTTRHRVSIMTAQGMQSFLLEDADAVTFTDPALRTQIDAALSAVSAHRTRDRRTLEVVSRGSGERRVRVGYVVAAPLWKASYRLALADAASKTARLQGWAVLENLSGQDWRDVELTLVSGNPVTFRQALYAAYYVDRPEVPVEVLGRVLPAPDAGSIGLDSSVVEESKADLRPSRSAAGSGLRARESDAGAFAKGQSMPAPAAMAAPMADEERPMPAPPPPPGQAQILAAASSEAATSVSFRIPYPVTVTSGQSLLAPLIDREVPAVRVAVYQPATHERHPLAAVRLTNDGDTGLPPGVLTLYESGTGGSSFVGDAQISPLPAGEQRLVSYALDQKTVVDREVDSARAIVKGRIVNGALELNYSQSQTTTYRMKAPAKESRRVLLEHPRSPGWTLDEPEAATTELSATSYRIAQELKAGTTETLRVVVSQPRRQRIGLVRLNTSQFIAYSENGDLKPSIRKAFEEMARLRAELDSLERLRQVQEDKRAALHQEQKRIRDNLGRVPRDSDLHKRYLKKLNTQEDRLEALQAHSDNIRRDIGAARKALADFIQKIDL